MPQTLSEIGMHEVRVQCTCSGFSRDSNERTDKPVNEDVACFFVVVVVVVLYCIVCLFVLMFAFFLTRISIRKKRSYVSISFRVKTL